MLRYAITGRAGLPSGQRPAELLADAARWAALAAPDGIDFVQLREKDLEAGALASLARRMLAALRSGGPVPRLLLNSRADVAIAVRAAGVHLTSAPGSLTPAQVRALYAAAGLPTPIVSVSCHTLAEVAAARASAATLILFGPVFQKQVGSQPVAAGSGLDLLRAACADAAPVSVLALGGVTAANTAACLAAGAAGIAAIRLFQGESPASHSAADPVDLGPASP